MKTKTLILLAFVLFSAMTWVSCSKDDDTPPLSDKLIPSAIVYNTTSSSSLSNIQTTATTYEFTYDDKNRISAIRIEYADDGVPRRFTTHVALSYEGNKLTSTTTRTDMPTFELKESFVVNEGEIMLSGAPSYNEHYKIRLDDNLRALKYKKVPQAVSSYFYEFTYDREGNTHSVTFYPSDDVERTHTYEFVNDLSNGVFQHVNTPAWYLTTQLELGGIEYQNLKNNCIKSLVGDEVIYEYVNTYNSVDYPEAIQRKAVGIDGTNAVSYTIKYTAAR